MGDEGGGGVGEAGEAGGEILEAVCATALAEE